MAEILHQRVGKYLRIWNVCRIYFKKCFFILIKCFLYNKGLIKTRAFDIRCKDGSQINLPSKSCRVVFSILAENFLHVLSCKDKVFVLQDFVIPIHELIVSDEDCSHAIRYGWRYNTQGKFWIKNNIRFKHMRYAILSVFEYDFYRYINVLGKTVIDVGAYIGVTTIYFALKGARRIIAIEPHPGAFLEMAENIKLNGLEDKAILINAGLSAKPGKLCIRDIDIKQTYRTYINPSLSSPCENEVPVITLSDIIEKYNISDAILKMNCEGCEYDVLLNEDPKIFSAFDHLFIGYHHGYEELKKILEAAGFKVNILPVRGRHIEEQGFIIAERRKV